MIVKANKENVAAFHKRLCAMLDTIIDIFDKYNIRWFSDSGTTLGCIRDGKIIDWDNDIDIVLPIADYVKFLSIAETELPGNLVLNNTMTCDNVHRLHTTVVDKNTFCLNFHDYYETCDEAVQFMLDNPLDMCLTIDIYGYEHVPEKHTKMFKDYVQWTNFLQNHLCKRWKHPELIDQIDIDYSRLLHTFYMETLLRIDKAYENSDYIIVHNCIPITAYEDLQLKAKYYDSYIEMPLKDLKHSLRIPVGYEAIMFLTYGEDYMTPKQTQHVGCDAYGFIFDLDSKQEFNSVEDFRQVLKQYKGE